MNRHAIGALGATAMLALATSPTSSHIVLETSQAAPRAAFKAVLRVPHGCDGAPTTSIAVTIPEGLIAAKPMPKPGWTLDITKGDYAKSYAFYHGTSLATGATAITWKGGSLPDDEYDEFVISAYVSDSFKPGEIVAMPVVQTCTNGKTLRWTEMPKAGQSEHDLKTPAPTFRILEAPRDSHHH